MADEDRQMSPGEIKDFIIRTHEQVSTWDSSPSEMTLDSIDEEMLKEYIAKANEVGRIDYPYTTKDEILKKLGLLKKGKLCNAAEVMFGFAPDIQLQMAIFATEERVTFNDIFRTNGRIRDLIDFGESYIKRNIRYGVVIDGSKIEREEIPEVPLVAIREALTNSYAHRNFRTPQNNEIAIFSDRIEIYNPGTFPFGMLPEDFLDGSGSSVHRNPLLAGLLYKTKDIESFGTGLKRIADACNAADVRFEFHLRKLGFAVVFHRSSIHGNTRKVPQSFSGRADGSYSNLRKNLRENLRKNLREKLQVTLTEKELDVLELIEEDAGITIKAIAHKLDVSDGAITQRIRTLKIKGVLLRVGTYKSGHWEIVNP
jgi:ATP-dependent DNA helicase RecG